MSSRPPNPIYIELRSGDVAETKELVDGQVMADFDDRGRLLGVEILPGVVSDAEVAESVPRL